MNEKIQCIKCSSENVKILKETLEYCSDINLCYINLQCLKCDTKMIGYFETKKIVEG